MDKELKIIPPEGYEVDEEHSTFKCIKFRPIKRQLPKSWKQFCEVYPIQEGEAYINNVSTVTMLDKGNRNFCTDKNVLPSKEMAEAVLALCQLLQLRDYYNNGWEPDWCNDRQYKYCINFCGTKKDRVQLMPTEHLSIAHVLAFKSQKLREEFIKNFKDLLEIAKPLL